MGKKGNSGSRRGLLTGFFTWRFTLFVLLSSVIAFWAGNSARDYWDFLGERGDLYQEMHDDCGHLIKQSVEKTWSLAEPYLTNEVAAKYRSWIESIGFPAPCTSARSATHNETMKNLAVEMSAWAINVLRKSSVNEDRVTREKIILAQTPHDRILKIQQAVEKMILYFYEPPPGSSEEVRKMRNRFADDLLLLKVLLNTHDPVYVNDDG